MIFLSTDATLEPHYLPQVCLTLSISIFFLENFDFDRCLDDRNENKVNSFPDVVNHQ